MAYSAVTSLRHTINRFLKSVDIQIVNNSSREVIKLLEEEVGSLENVLKGLDNNSRRFSCKRLNNVDAQITEAVFKLEDLLEFHLLDQFLSQSQNHQYQFLFSLDLEELKQGIDSLIQTVKKMKAEYIYELSSNNLSQEEEEEEEDEDDVIVKSEPRMFGISSNQILMETKDMLLSTGDDIHLIALWGMSWIGKTTLARKLFHDPLVSNYYECRAFVTVGPEYHLEDVLVDILKQLDPNSTIDDDEEIIMLLQEDHQEKLDGLGRRLKEYLKARKYLIVLDDVWDYKMLTLECFRYDGSHIFLTSRLQTFAEQMDQYCTIPFLDKKESWDLIRAKVFGDQQDKSSLCPPELEKAGKKIAENCDGLPLKLVTVANILSKHERTPELWNEVAVNKKTLCLRGGIC